jgi:hypothetical protein
MGVPVLPKLYAVIRTTGNAVIPLVVTALMRSFWRTDELVRYE